MQRRKLLRRIGAASTVVFGASATASASSAPDGIADADRLIRLDESGERVVLDVSDVEDPADLDGPSTLDDCDENCVFECCSDCTDYCYDHCGGCLCGNC